MVKIMRVKQCEIVCYPESVKQTEIDKIIKHSRVSKYFYALHDKDVDKHGELKKEHYHIYLKFKDSVDTDTIISGTNIKSNMVNKIHGTWGDCILYITHTNRPDKHQYGVDIVKSNFNFKEDHEKEVKNIGNKRTRTKKHLIDLINKKEITRKNLFGSVNIHEYVKYKKYLEEALEYVEEKAFNYNRTLEVIFIAGNAGAGKTTLAKYIAQQKGQDYIIKKGTKDPFDGLHNEECLIFDDIKPDTLTLSKFIDLTDNHTAASYGSRYKDKKVMIETIIFTSSLDIMTFFNSLQGTENQDPQQFFRRVENYIVIHNDTQHYFTYDKSKVGEDLHGVYFSLLDKKDFVKMYNTEKSSKISVLSMLKKMGLYSEEDENLKKERKKQLLAIFNSEELNKNNPDNDNSEINTQ